ncbi:MAG: DUF4253 domain-containing protein [Deltaproteobacteria bacterium]|nr:DUF4253 domain-containing protein [Deltaproteobacteria bacterium]
MKQEAILSSLKEAGLTHSLEQHEELEGPRGPVLSMPIARETAFDAWKSLFSRREAMEACPVVLADIPMIEENFDLNEASELDMARAARQLEGVNVAPWLTERLEEAGSAYLSAEPQAPAGPVSESGGFHLLTSKELRLALVPTVHAWEIPLLLGFGGFNDCPEPVEHAAVLRRWQESHGARLFALSGSVLELVVDHPPSTGEAALALAREQFAYCTDIVTQGTQTVEQLAAGLWNAPRWFFWWD